MTNRPLFDCEPISYLHRRDKEILGTYYADYELYGVKYDGSRA